MKQRIEQSSQTTKATEAEKTAPAAETAGPKATTTEKNAAAPSVAETPPVQTSEAAQEQEKAPAAVQGTQQGEGVAGQSTVGIEGVSLKNSLLDDTFPKYDPTDKIDPFAALFTNESETDLSDDSEPKRTLTPLEKIDISQLKLVAVLLAESGNRAMVEDATGKPYILTSGTYIGVNSGTVTKILIDRVVIEEITKDLLGRESARTRELKLQKPFGEE